MESVRSLEPKNTAIELLKRGETTLYNLINE